MIIRKRRLAEHEGNRIAVPIFALFSADVLGSVIEVPTLGPVMTASIP